MRSTHWILSGFLLLAINTTGNAQDRPSLSQLKADATATVDQMRDFTQQTLDMIFSFGELGFQEIETSAYITDILEANGFEVERGISGMPTAWMATWGSGKPVIALGSDIDGIPKTSQKPGVAYHDPIIEGAPGHGEGHNSGQAVNLTAAIAVKEIMEREGIPGTLKLWPGVAEEQLGSKAYFVRDGFFDDVDIVLFSHVSNNLSVSYGPTSGSGLVSIEFTFHGEAAHGAGAPWRGRSALDAVELMNIGANFMREHVKEDARIHYVIVDGGGAPNVVPPKATVWYFARADGHKDVEYNFNWLQDIAAGAAKMTRTKLSIQIDTDCHEIIPNAPIAQLVTKNMQQIGAPSFTEEEKLFARRLQAPLIEQFGTDFPIAIDDTIHPTTVSAEPSKGSTDVGDISWRVPTGGLRTTCLAAKSPGHSWQNVAAIGSTIGEKGIVYASKTLAVSALSLFEDPKLIAAARADWEQRMLGRKYFSFIPDGQRPPKQIR